MWLVSVQPLPWDPQQSWLFWISFLSFFALHIFFLSSWPRSTVTRFPLCDLFNRPRLRQKPYAIEWNHYSTSPSLFPFIWEEVLGFCLVHFGPGRTVLVSSRSLHQHGQQDLLLLLILILRSFQIQHGCSDTIRHELPPHDGRRRRRPRPSLASAVFHPG